MYNLRLSSSDPTIINSDQDIGDVLTPPLPPPTPPPSPWAFPQLQYADRNGITRASADTLTTHQTSCASLLSPKTDTSTDEESNDHAAHQTVMCELLSACSHKIGQVVVKRQVNEGVKLYTQQQYSAAVSKWQRSLSKLTSNKDKFHTLTYLCQAHLDWGRYREVKEYAMEQLHLAEKPNEPALWAEAYWNFARAHEQVGEYDKAIHCCRQAVYHLNDATSDTHGRLNLGHLYLCLGNAFLGMSNFSKAVEHFNLAFSAARQSKEKELELQVYLGFGTVFSYLQDWEKGAKFLNRALEMAKSISHCDISTRFQRAALSVLSLPLRKVGNYKDAKRVCQDAMRMASSAEDVRTKGRTYLMFGDLYRSRLDTNRAYMSYKSAVQLSSQLEDRYCHVLSMIGIAKCLQLLARKAKFKVKSADHPDGNVCLCRPLELCNKALLMASDMGSKSLMRLSHIQLASVYQQLGDHDNVRLQQRLASVLVEEMELTCSLCQQHFGIHSGNSLDALPCSHLFHASCAQEILKKASEGHRRRRRQCPECHKSLTSRVSMFGYEELRQVDASFTELKL